MKFKDFVDGKRYENGGFEYEKVDGGLWCVTTDEYSAMSMARIMKMEFEEVVEFVNYIVAIQCMLHGGKANFNFLPIDFEFKNGVLGYYSGCDFIQAVICTDMVTDEKWRLR